MPDKDKVTQSDDNNRRDRDNKADRKEVKEFKSPQQRRGDLKGGGHTQGARTKQTAGK